jgi:hypothetical protein
MCELSTLAVWTVLILVVLALLVYIAAKAVERRNPPIGKFLEIEGPGCITLSAAPACRSYFCTAMRQCFKTSY